MTKKERLSNLMNILNSIYPEVACSLDYKTPIQMLIATQLSAQCTDANVNKVTKDLFNLHSVLVSLAAWLPLLFMQSKF